MHDNPSLFSCFVKVLLKGVVVSARPTLLLFVAHQSDETFPTVVSPEGLTLLVKVCRVITCFCFLFFEEPDA